VARSDSDIDIVCCAADRSSVATLLWEHFREADDFALYQWSARGRPVIAKFSTYGWPFEIFASATPVQDQAGWRHFDVEKRLLSLGGPAFRTTICAFRAGGVKTEPAFARALELEGGPLRRPVQLVQRL
jgi:hypothetical protein